MENNIIIDSASDLTVEFLSKALNRPEIESFTTKRVGTGQVGECYRVFLNSAGDAGHQPATVILKISSQDPRSRTSGVSMGIYERETRFYADLGPVVKKSADFLPACSYTAFDKSTGAFTLILEDAGEKAAAGNDIEGATFEQAQAAFHALGEMQASLLAIPSKPSWLGSPSPVTPAFFKQLFKTFKMRHASKVDPEHLEMCERFVASFSGWSETLQKPGAATLGLIHGDYRIDNMLFSTNENGSCRPLVVDWQLIAVAPLLTDVAYFFGCSLKPQDRREWQDSLLKTYCDAFNQISKEPLVSVEVCKKELQLQAFFGIVMAIVSSILVVQTTRGDEMFLTLLERSCELCKDFDSFSILPEPVDDSAPLQPEAADEKTHAPGPEKLWNESWYFDFVDEAQGVAGWVRLGLTPNVKGNWYQATFTQTGKPIVIVSDFLAPSPDDKLHLKTDSIDATHEVLHPLEQFHLTLDGTGQAFENPTDSFDQKSAPPAKLHFNLTWETDGAPYRYKITTRYEIPCRISGTVRVNDGSEIKLDRVPGQRDHSFGTRDWWSMDWVWLAFHLDNGLHVHATELKLPNQPSMGMGYVQQEGKAVEIVSALCSDETTTDKGLTGSMKVKIDTHGGQKDVIASVKLKGHTPLTLVSEDGRQSQFERGWGEVNLTDGSRGVGWFEWNRNGKQ